jgi:hypothetical protein
MSGKTSCSADYFADYFNVNPINLSVADAKWFANARQAAGGIRCFRELGRPKNIGQHRAL